MANEGDASPVKVAAPSREAARGVRVALPRPWLVTVCRLVLGLVFLYAGAPKVWLPQAFLVSVRSYMILPDDLVPAFTVVLPTIELVAGLLLVLDRWVRPAAVVVGGMLCVFVVAIVSAMARGLDIECGCFSHGETAVGIELLVRDAIMLAMLIPVILTPRRGGA